MTRTCILLFAAVTASATSAQDLATLSDQSEREFGAHENLYLVEAVMVLDDRLLVADRGSNSILSYSIASGSLEGRFGREGGGPGEFEGLTDIQECNGRLMAWDPLADRVTFFGEGLATETVPLPVVDGAVPQAVICSGDQLVARYRRGEVWPELGPFRLPVALRALSLDGVPKHVLAEVPGDERNRSPTSEGPRLFGLKTFMIPSEYGIIVGTGDAYSLTLHDREGVTQGTMGAEGDRPEILEEDLQERNRREYDLVLRRFGQETANGLRANQAVYDYPSHYPAYVGGFGLSVTAL